MSDQIIFYSDFQVEEFQVDHSLTSSISPIVDVQIYLSKFALCSSEQPEVKPTPNKKKGKAKVQNQFIDVRSTSSEDQDSNNDYVPMDIQKPIKIKKKQRSSDQNICKKYHCLANKCLRKLKLQNYMSKSIGKIYRKSYFIMTLEVAKKANKLKEFMDLYYEISSDTATKCQNTMKSSFNGSKDYRKNKQLLKAIINSLQAMSYYEDGKIYESLQKLFEVHCKKKVNWVDTAMNEVIQFGQNFQSMN